MRLLLIGCLTLNHFQRFAAWFSSRGHVVDVLTFPSYVPSDGFPAAQVHVFPYTQGRIGLPQSTKWMHLPFVRRLVSETKPDIVHAHFLTEFGIYGSFSGASTRPITLTGSDGYFNWQTSSPLWVINELAVQAASHVFVPSEDLANLLRRVFMVRRHKITVLPDGVQDILVESYPPSRWRKDGNLVVSTRRLSRVYDLATLVRAAAQVNRRLPASRFVIAGDGPDRSLLVKQASDLGLGTHLEFRGWLKQMDLADLLATSSIYVSTSHSDGSSVSLLEAMALGAFPIVSDIAANRAWIEHGRNGLLFEPGNAEQLAARIIEAMENRDLSTRIALANRTVVDQKARFTKSMEILEKYYFAHSR